MAKNKNTSESLTKRMKRTMIDIRYERVGMGTRYAKNVSGKYLETFEVEERITRKIGWYAAVIPGGVTCRIQFYDCTKVFSSEYEAMDAGLQLPTKDTWKFINKDWEFIGD